MNEKNPLTKEESIYTLYIFEWDSTKAEINLKKHQVSFDEEDNVIRIISSRKANKRESAQYWARRK